MSSASPMGTTAVAGGAMTFASPSALCSRSRSSPWSRSAGAVGLTFAIRQTCGRDGRRDAREVVAQDLFDRLAGRVGEHRLEHPELDPVRVRLDLLRLARKLARDAREVEPLALG